MTAAITPELPEPTQRLVEIQGTKFYVEPTPGVYTRDQMLAMYRKGLEDAAAKCDEVEREACERFCDDMRAASAYRCATAIRAMKG